MTISFFEPGDVPQPPEKTKIEHLSATPSSDGWRVRVEIHVTPFQVRPSLEMKLLKVETTQSEPVTVASFSIVETMHPRMEFTMHIRGVKEVEGAYRLDTALYYREAPKEGSEALAPMQMQDQKKFEFKITVEEPTSE